MTTVKPGILLQIRSIRYACLSDLIAEVDAACNDKPDTVYASGFLFGMFREEARFKGFRFWPAEHRIEFKAGDRVVEVQHDALLPAGHVMMGKKEPLQAIALFTDVRC